MSLLVWLPLQGNLNNQGTSGPINNIALTSGNSWDTDTKIGGQSLKMTQRQTIFPAHSIMSGVKQFTVCYWIKVNEAWAEDWLDGFRWIQTNGESTATGRQEFYSNCTKIGVWYSGGSSSNKTGYVGVWMHLAFSVDYDAGICKFYRNGMLIGTATNVNKAYYCRGDFYIGDTGVNICMNDLRLYNNILSTAEIKEIARGMVLHYKLDNHSCRNLLPGTTSQTKFTANSVNWAAGQWSLQSSGNGTARIVSDRADLPISGITQYWTIDNNTSGNRDHGMVVLPRPTEVGQPYTISLYARGTGIFQFRIWCNGGAAQTKSWALTEDWTYYTWSYTATENMLSYASTAIIGIKGAGQIDMCAIQLEHGTTATPWTPHPNDFCDAPRITDSSGYGHHGVIADTQALDYRGDSARYNSSIYIADGAINYIQTPELSFPTDAITMNIWFKSTNTEPTANYHMLVDSVSNRVNYEMCIHKSGYFRAGLSIDGTRKADNCTSTECLNGEWHMLTLTYDGATVKRYTDAVLESSTETTGALVANDILRIGKDGSDDYACIDSYLSDFRIYCTALPDTDIKMLYNTSMRIDRLQNIHTFEVDETMNGISISKTSKLNCNNITENSTVKFYKTGAVEAAQLIER